MTKRLLIAVTLATLATALPSAAQSCLPSSTTLCIDPISWNVIGLDSNKPGPPQNQGPDTFMVGARGCNYTSTTLTGITATYSTLGATNPYINLADNSTITLSELKPGRCEDFYFNGQITRTSAAYNTTQQFQITVSSTGPTVLSAATPLNRELYIEKLIEQNRNSVGAITGPTDLQVGGIYTFNVQWSTATGGYEQLEHFVNLANTNFRLLSSYSVYDQPAGATNTTIYADACGWDNNILSGTYRSCIGPANYTGGKAGGSVNTYFTVQILGATPVGGSRLKALIYDFSGSSYHYNTDFNSGTQGLVVSASAAADLGVTISDSPDPVQPGALLTYSGIVTNNGLSPLTTSNGGKLTIPIPPDTTFSSITAPAGWTCGLVGSAVECTPNTTMLSGASTGYSLQVTVGAGVTSGTIIPAVATISSNLQDSNPTNNTATASTTVIASNQADLVVTNTVSAVVQQGTTFAFTQTVTNIGPAAAANPTFTTSIPSGTTFSSITAPAGWTCGPVVGSSITCSGSSPLAASGGSASFSLNLVASGASGTVTSSTAYAETSTAEPSTSNNVATATVGIVAANSADLSIVVSDFPDPVVAGETILYTQTVTNNGLVAASNVTVSFPTPPNTTYSYIDYPAGWTCSTFPLPGSPTPGSAGTVTCTKASVAVGETASFPLTVTVGSATPDGTLIDYTATVSSTTPDSISSNNTSSAQTLVGAATAADVEVVKTSSANPTTTGSNLVYTLRVTNNGPATATNIVVTDPLPSNLTYVSAVTSQGSCSYDAGPRTVTCPIGTLNVGATAVVTVRTSVDAGASGLTLANTASVTRTETDPRAANNSSSNQTVVVSATAAEMFDAGAERRNGRVELYWNTSYEVDNIGFNVYRESGGLRTRTTRSLIAGSTLITGAPLTAGFSYRWNDDAPEEGGVYWIEDVDLNGTSTFHGPIVPGGATAPTFAHKASRMGSEVASVTLDSLGRTPPGARRPVVRPVSLATGAEAMPDDVIRSKQFDIAASPAVKLLVRDAGYYRVTRAEIAASGFDPGTDPRALQLFVDGSEIPIAVLDGGDGRWDDVDAFEFFAVGMDTTYSGTRSYWLLTGNNGERFKPKSKTKATPETSSGFAQSILRKDRLVYFSAQTNAADRDSFYGPVLYTSPVVQTLELANIDSSGSGARLEVAIQGATYTRHLVRVQLNGTMLGTIDFAGQETGYRSFTIGTSLLVDGPNEVVLSSLLGPNDVSFLDYVGLTYPHTYAADGNRLHFTMPGAKQARITGFTDPEIRVIDVTNPLQPEEIENSVVKEGATWTLVVSPHEKGQRTIFASAVSIAEKPESIAANVASSLSSRRNTAEFVIITDPLFADALKPLAAKRTAEGLATMIVGVDDVFDEFGFGSKSPDAIRDFLAYARENWSTAPHFVMLVGDATFDPRNYIGYGDRDLVPTRILPTKYMKTASDEWLADLNGDGLQDLFIGRLPVATVADAEAAVEKIVNYQPPATNRVLQVVDINDKTYSFSHAADLARTAVPTTFAIDRFDVTKSATARAALRAAILSGAAVVNYFGHGSIEGWGNTNVLRSQDMPSFANTGITPLYVMMNCLNGYFHDVWSTSLGEALIRTPKGGAVAVWASSGISDPPPQSDTVNAFWRILASQPSVRLGELAARAKESTDDPEIRKTWVLFGDPTMRLFD